MQWCAGPTAVRLPPHLQTHQAAPAIAGPTGPARGTPGLLPIRRTPPRRQVPGSHCKSALRQPRVLRRSTSVRTRGEAGFLARSARPIPHLPITRSRSSRRVPRTRRGCNPIRYRSGYRHSRRIRVVHARIHHNQLDATPAALPLQRGHHPGTTESSGECSRSSSRTAAARPSSCESPDSPHPPARPALQPGHRSTAPQPARRSDPCQDPPARRREAARHMRNRKIVRVHIGANRATGLLRDDGPTPPPPRSRKPAPCPP